MTRNLLAIERNFLTSNEIVRVKLNLQAVESLQKSIMNGQKAKFDKSIELSKLVKAGVDWIKSEEAAALLREEGITWSVEEFFSKVYGWQKSFGYKMAKAGGFATDRPEVVTDFVTKCNEVERSGETANRTIEGLLAYVKQADSSRAVDEDTENGEGSGEGEGGSAEASVTREKTIFTMTFKATEAEGVQLNERNVALRINSEGILVTRNTADEISQAVAWLISTCRDNQIVLTL